MNGMMNDGPNLTIDPAALNNASGKLKPPPNRCPFRVGLSVETFGRHRRILSIAELHRNGSFCGELLIKGLHSVAKSTIRWGAESESKGNKAQSVARVL